MSAPRSRERNARPVRARAARPRRPGAAPGDAGLTLIEVVVALSIMSVLMAMVTAGIVRVFHAAAATESVSTAQSQLNTAFLRLDKEIRYAAAISVPGTVGADAYVEYVITNSGTSFCTELRLRAADRRLLRRGWVQGGTPLVPGPWVALASGVTAATPFTRTDADATFPFQRLRLRLVTVAGAGATGASRGTDVTFTALNTSLATAGTTVCTEGRAVP